MLVVEFRHNSPVLQEALSHAPETTAKYEEMYQSNEGTTFLFWAEGGDLTAFDDALAADPTVTNASQLTETETRRLYRVDFTAQGEAMATVSKWNSLDLSILDATGSKEGWELRMRMPDRGTLQQYHEFCDERNLQFQLQSVYEETTAASKADAQLTNAQREALLTARRLGYFEIPRQASMADVADCCHVSSQAVSERIRRGTAALVDVALPTAAT